MSWFKVDDGFANSKPVLRIPRRQRAAAVGLWVLAGTWSAKELTDGFIPDYALEDFCASPAVAEILVRAGLWESSEEGWQFVGWEKYQFTKAKVMEHRAAEAEKKRKWREAKATEQAGDDTVPSLSPGDSSGTPLGTTEMSRLTRPDQTRPVLSLVTSGGELTQVSDPEPPRFCPDHPNGTPDGCGPCKEARLAHEDWTKREKQRQQSIRDEHRRRSLNCRICHGTNLVEVAEDEFRKCTHQEEAHA